MCRVFEHRAALLFFKLVHLLPPTRTIQQDAEAERLATSSESQRVPTDEGDADPLAAEPVITDQALRVSKNAPGISTEAEAASGQSADDGGLLTATSKSEGNAEQNLKQAFCSRLGDVLGNGVFILLALGCVAGF